MLFGEALTDLLMFVTAFTECSITNRTI